MLLRYKRVKIRKHHFCWGCARDFKPPASMLLEVVVDAGKIENIYFCPTCEGILYDSDYNDVCFGELYEEAVLIEGVLDNDKNN